MRDKNPTTQDALPESFDTLDELWAFWDTHSSADFEDSMQPVEVVTDAFSSKVYLPVAKDLLRRVRDQARQQGISPETLVNLWLQEKLSASA